MANPRSVREIITKNKLKIPNKVIFIDIIKLKAPRNVDTIKPGKANKVHIIKSANIICALDISKVFWYENIPFCLDSLTIWGESTQVTAIILIVIAPVYKYDLDKLSTEFVTKEKP